MKALKALVIVGMMAMSVSIMIAEYLSLEMTIASYGVMSAFACLLTLLKKDNEL